MSLEDIRMGHLRRTAAVWARLIALGATEQSELDFDFQFVAHSKSAADALMDALSDYPLSVQREGILRKTWTISGHSGSITWTEARLLQWVDYLIHVGHDAGCEFLGCGAAATQ